ncbi:hypothetical protein EWH08_13455 [Sphingobium indicum]|uniref:Ferric reductase like transmembrane component n=2 Tax=Sphingobium indicum TaxID=332055 RepID=A0A1L5BQI4_SPHIB|nr:hypothetical protein [Sphingobium indicum]APL95164.1 hypothetical protein SIDU_11945 [Sphingobium indicum B90A]KEY97115.1 hypothetical protein AI27_21330 [Sphingomonas sp. BHC-A]NYI23465.1 hypothetical protein [Sphingobium indicum]RYM01668.1 hypothetical protein EWH08_13455 [Sphingobium indicum]
MATRAANPARRAKGEVLHDGFLRHAGFRWLKIATLICVLSIASYMLVDVTPRHNGGSWYGYAMGTIGVLLILWLTLLGLRKRAMTGGRWSLKAWTSAHVYLGLSLIVVATLHTGFQLGWNVHTLAYALMMLVIFSGLFGITVYATLPAALSNNRAEMTQVQMLDAVRAIDRQLHDAAQPLTHEQAALVRQSLEDDPFGGGLLARLSGRYPRCATARAQAALRRWTGEKPDTGNDPLERIDALLERKQAMLARLRRHLKLKALLEIWLYVHVPATFALLAALTAHVVSVFFYW